MDVDQTLKCLYGYLRRVQEQFQEFAKYRAIVRHDGLVRWEPAGVFETSCRIDISHYPYDRQQCALVFGTWTYTSDKVSLHSRSI